MKVSAPRPITGASDRGVLRSMHPAEPACKAGSQATWSRKSRPIPSRQSCSEQRHSRYARTGTQWFPRDPSIQPRPGAVNRTSPLVTTRLRCDAGGAASRSAVCVTRSSPGARHVSVPRQSSKNSQTSLLRNG